MSKDSMLPLIPNYWKKIGLIIVILLLILVLSQPFLLPGFDPKDHKVADVIFSSVFMTGLFCVAFSKDKTEDEMTIKLRWQALSFAVILTIVSVIICPVLDILFGGAVDKTDGVKLINQLLIFYLISYYIRKSFR